MFISFELDRIESCLHGSTSATISSVFEIKVFMESSVMCVWRKPAVPGHEMQRSPGTSCCFLRFMFLSGLVRSQHFIYNNEAFCVFQDSTLYPLIQRPTTTLSSLTVPVGHWWQSVLLWKTLPRIARRGREPACLQVLTTATSQVFHQQCCRINLWPQILAVLPSAMSKSKCKCLYMENSSRHLEKLWYSSSTFFYLENPLPLPL